LDLWLLTKVYRYHSFRFLVFFSRTDFCPEHVYGMDGDVSVEPELDGFSRVLPLPYRIGVIFVLGNTSARFAHCSPANSPIGVWAWGVNLHYLSILKIVRDKSFTRNPIQLTEATGLAGSDKILDSLLYYTFSPSANI